MLWAQSEIELVGFPPHFGVMLLALACIFCVAMALFALSYRLIDRATPGKLCEELVPPDQNKQPNRALAMVVSAMILGMSLILSATIIGVLMH